MGKGRPCIAVQTDALYYLRQDKLARRNAMTDTDIKAAFARVDLERFAPRGQERFDGPIRTFSDADGTTLSAISDRTFLRWIVGELGDLRGKRIYEIGTGTGYLVSVLAQLAGSEGEIPLIFGCEIIPDLFDQSQRALIGTSGVRVQLGDWVDRLPELGLFDVIIATSAFRGIPRLLRQALRVPGGLLAMPIAIPGGGDCFTVFHATEEGLSTIDARMSVSVPTTGSMADEDTWYIPLEKLVDPRPGSFVHIEIGQGFGHPVLDTLGFRSYLFGAEPKFHAVNLGGERTFDLRNYAFGLIDGERRSGALYHHHDMLAFGDLGLECAGALAAHRERWKTNGRSDLSQVRYHIPWAAFDADRLPSGYVAALGG
ncbi:methyltransferase domain-containing protein [Mesorhizobium sp. LSJC285A00]|uniref:protein-L-isoaspartate O-methyltransferase family protein n=1 Tax=Mesorhizobium sp. LSJC285A00 TaxID=1287338 RepID=UPI00247812B4|nr:methyltransferase domain-containing protein [Mesorhizobium sp. LSJC285A00]